MYEGGKFIRITISLVEMERFVFNFVGMKF